MNTSITAFAVIGRNSSSSECPINNWEGKQCCEGNNSIENEELKHTVKSRTDAFDYNTVEVCAAQDEVIDYFAPLGEDTSWNIQNAEEGSESSLLSIPPLCQEGPLFMAPEAKDLEAEDSESGKDFTEFPAASIEILRKANTEQRQQCGAILALCRELEEGRSFAQDCASLFSGEINSAQESPRPLPVSGSSKHLGPYQQWLAREMAWSVKLPSSIGPSLSGVQCLAQSC